MKAVWYDRQGPAQEVLQYGELPTPKPASGEVRVRLAFSAVNPADANRRGGKLHAMDFPRIVPHSDGAGTVDAVGEGVDSRWLGTRVWVYFGQRGRPWGTAAQFICVPQELAAPLPDSLSFQQGACLGIPCMTAYCSLGDLGDLAGKNVLVTGGAGAVGHYAVQLAKWAGATVLASVSSPEKAEHTARGGADIVIDYVRQDLTKAVLDATHGAGVDLIVDVDAAANLQQVLSIAAPQATWVSYASGAEPEALFPFAALIRKNLTLRGLYLSGLPVPARRAAQQGVLRWLSEAPDGLHTVDDIYPLRDTARAHLAVEARRKLGTVLVSCD
ncbi:MAG: NADPH:quinone reductase [bacterium]